MLNRYIKCLLFPAIIAIVSCNDEKQNEQAAEVTETQPAEPTQVILPATLVNQYPHKASAYTEGLQFADGFMYESTGRYGQSYIYKYEAETGKLIKEYKLDDKYFGEGLTIIGDKMYVLTYKEKTGLIFDKNTFKQLGTFPIRTNEGWGMTNDSTHLICSDGTPYLYFLNPETFEEVKRLEVMDKYGPVSNINELEYINGYIYANKWETELILKIDPNSGKVVGQADLGRIRAQAGIPPKNSYVDSQPEVMNGIAYDKATNRIFITGKNWPKILEVKIDN